jgi:hypothetical protein
MRETGRVVADGREANDAGIQPMALSHKRRRSFAVRHAWNFIGLFVDRRQRFLVRRGAVQPTLQHPPKRASQLRDGVSLIAATMSDHYPFRRPLDHALGSGADEPAIAIKRSRSSAC